MHSVSTNKLNALSCCVFSILSCCKLQAAYESKRAMKRRWMNPSPTELKHGKRANAPSPSPSAVASGTSSWMTPSPGSSRVSLVSPASETPPSAEASRSWMTPSPGTSRVSLVSPVSETVQPHREVHLDMATVLMAATEVTQEGKQSSFACNGANAGRVATVLRKGCRCTFRCRDTLNANLTAVQEFCWRFHGLTPEARLHLLEVCYRAIVF